MNINLTQCEFKGIWYATDSDTYDGAPDGNRVYGSGHTKVLAVLDLYEQLYENEIYTDDELLEYLTCL